MSLNYRTTEHCQIAEGQHVAMSWPIGMDDPETFRRELIEVLAITAAALRQINTRIEQGHAATYQPSSELIANLNRLDRP